MKYIKTALLAGALASVSSLAFAQGGGASAGVDFRALNQAPAYSDGNASYARASQHVRTRTVSHSTTRQRETTGSGFTSGSSVGSPD